MIALPPRRCLCASSAVASRPAALSNVSLAKRSAPARRASSTAFRASARSSGEPGSSGLMFSRAASWFIRYEPRLSSSYFAWIASTLPSVPSRSDVLHHDDVARLRDGEIGLGGDDQAERLQLRRHLHLGVVIVHLDLAEVGRASFGRDRPEHVGEVLAPETRRRLELVEARVDLDVALLAGHRRVALAPAASAPCRRSRSSCRRCAAGS